jgi:hypothetical protein
MRSAHVFAAHGMPAFGIGHVLSTFIQRLNSNKTGGPALCSRPEDKLLSGASRQCQGADCGFAAALE